MKLWERDTSNRSNALWPRTCRQHIADTLLIDTHEHLRKERDWVENGPDILQDLFGNYVPADLIAAGADSRGLAQAQRRFRPRLGRAL